MGLLTVVPAYGADYSLDTEVIAALKQGKDFLIRDISNRYDGKPMSIRDAVSLLRTGYTGLKIRYRSREDILVVDFKAGEHGSVFVYHTGNLLGEVTGNVFHEH